MFLYNNKINIYYKIKGNKSSTPIIFLHGFMESLKIWNYISDFLSQKYKIILIDFPGHGKSSFSGEENIFSMEKSAEIVKSILEKEKIEKAVFVGHSMGGYISLALAERNPEIFLGLCLLHSTASSDSIERKQNRKRSIQLIKENYSLFVSTSVNKLFNPIQLKSLQKEFNLIKKIALSTSVSSVISFLRGMSIRKDRKFLLKKTNFPKLYIIGIYDLILDAKEIRNESKNGYKSSFVEIPTGHIGPIENPEKIIEILENFMKYSVFHSQ
ncbi:alpha/beta fold hydrolase [Blattabacterium cuenoti]|uniref:alpha/beta fold hydrolase n=1 Tax=Blattabacterium cuenoti TaxID=1653831 RepID=UPI00163C53A1|nr:alpha/beta hydrolase [Blattabacterium cuenoti]